MAITFKALGSFVLANSTTTSITFSNIPQTFTDLVVRYTAKDTNDSPLSELKMYFNGQTISNTNWNSFGGTYNGNGTAAGYEYLSSYTARFLANQPASVYYGQGYGYGEIYIANYTNTSYAKRLVSQSAVNTNTTTADRGVFLYGEWTQSAAVTSIQISPSSNFVAGSRIDLFGIKTA